MKDSKPTLHIIVAIAEDGAIGFEGDMPWGRNLPRDLKHFKETTMGYPIVMGRKTFESLPKGALPGRLNIVISRNTAYEAQGATSCTASMRLFPWPRVSSTFSSSEVCLLYTSPSPRD